MECEQDGTIKNSHNYASVYFQGPFPLPSPSSLLKLSNDATIGGLVRELPQYIAGAATKDVVIECEGKKVEWWRVYVLSTTVALCQCAGFTSLVLDFLSLGRGVTKPKLKSS